ncbi:response regulator transcription factor [Jannaschia formosa]|uniref:response regulator transcription factor n=1 Tax=Jannaschia formosa TaxID=2259592 RepID=UPI000E1B9D8E|nr:response regulator transcription factor [Jannaschia formosa]TFL16180.1 response regulator transcription factor [Jannaschia formosa]
MNFGENQEIPLVAILDECTILSEAVRDRLSKSSSFRVELFSLPELDRICDASPEVVLVDPRQISTDPAELVGAIRTRLPKARLLAYCSSPEMQLASNCMKLGFDGFISKGAAFEQLRSALSIVAGGGVYLEQRFARAVLDHRGISENNIHLQEVKSEVGAAETLSLRESEVLRMLCLGFSPKQIAADLGLSRKTIDTYRMRGMRKLGFSDRSELVRYAVEQGWII